MRAKVLLAWPSGMEEDPGRVCLSARLSVRLSVCAGRQLSGADSPAGCALGLRRRGCRLRLAKAPKRALGRPRAAACRRTVAEGPSQVAGWLAAPADFNVRPSTRAPVARLASGHWRGERERDLLSLGSFASGRLICPVTQSAGELAARSLAAEGQRFEGGQWAGSLLLRPLALNDSKTKRAIKYHTRALFDNGHLFRLKLSALFAPGRSRTGERIERHVAVLAET